ncbi:MAG: hypothetical protein Q8865_09145 [Bacillota bacterium]|nr:hypothetical protein [Bacillota bacterium]
MDNESDMLVRLDEEIEKKCAELRRKRAEQLFQKLFTVSCVLFLIVPVLLAFTGVSIFTACLPTVIYMTTSLIFLTPILISNNLGGVQK